MALHDDTVKLRHMLDAREKAVLFAQNRTRTDLYADEKLALALTRLLEITGKEHMLKLLPSGLKLLDHVIISEEGTYSFADNGLLGELSIEAGLI